MSKKLTLAALAAILVLATVVGIVTFQPVSAHHSRTAAVDVTHMAWNSGDETYDIPVEPDTGESWAITGTWKLYGFPDTVQTAYVDVDWNGTSWVKSNETKPSGFLTISVCAYGECGTVMDPHGYGYKLIVELAAPLSRTWYPDSAEFVVSSIDDGYTLTGDPCDTDTSVSVISPYYFGVTDSAPFDTTFDCNASGPSLSIQYD